MAAGIIRAMNVEPATSGENPGGREQGWEYASWCWRGQFWRWRGVLRFWRGAVHMVIHLVIHLAIRTAIGTVDRGRQTRPFRRP